MGRRMRRQSQTDLAKALTVETGEEWTRFMVGNLEADRKTLDVETLMAIARIQNLPCSFYLEPLPGSTSLKGLFRDRSKALFNRPIPLAAA